MAIAAQAQQSERTRRIGLLVPFPDDRDRVQEYLPAFKQRLHELGWIESRNIRFVYRFTGQDAERIRTGAKELVALAPDVIVVWSNPAAGVGALVSHKVGDGRDQKCNHAEPRRPRNRWLVSADFLAYARRG
jgi:putative ABC transport system substrate-binding protein